MNTTSFASICARRFAPYQARDTHNEVVMNRAMIKILKTTSVAVELATSSYGIPMPTLRLTLPHGSSRRHASAAVHMLAAELELAIPESESWPVTIDYIGNDTGTITIELVKGTAEEAERAMALLRRSPLT